MSASLDCQCVTLAVGFQLACVEIMAEIVVNLDPRIDTISNGKGEGHRNVGEICPTLDLVPEWQVWISKTSTAKRSIKMVLLIPGLSLPMMNIAVPASFLLYGTETEMANTRWSIQISSRWCY